MTYLFDFDGTLVDSMHAYCRTMLRILDENNIVYPPDIMKIITPLGYVDTAKYFVNKLGLLLPETEIHKKMYEYAINEYRYNIEAKANVADTLKVLFERGHSLNILTASPHVMLDPCLERLGLVPLFDNVWSCEDFGTNKSDPDIYRMAAKKMGVAVGDVWFFDDNLNADKTAKAAGMRVCGVYDESSKDYEAQMRAVCDKYVRDFSQVLSV